jgi:hypothetical protein
MRELSLDEIFERLGDYDLCNAVSGAVQERYGYDFLVMWLESVPLTHKLTDFVWSMTGFLENEGFARFFNSECNHEAYPECFDILGLSSLATQIRTSLKLFPKVIWEILTLLFHTLARGKKLNSLLIQLNLNFMQNPMR